MSRQSFPNLFCVQLRRLTLVYFRKYTEECGSLRWKTFRNYLHNDALGSWAFIAIQFRCLLDTWTLYERSEHDIVTRIRVCTPRDNKADFIHLYLMAMCGFGFERG